MIMGLWKETIVKSVKCKCIHSLEIVDPPVSISVFGTKWKNERWNLLAQY